MNPGKLLPLALVGAAAAANLGFQPDTVHAGGFSITAKMSDTTITTNLTSASVRIELKRFLSPFKHSSELVVFQTRNKSTYAYKIDSATPLGTQFVMHLTKLMSNGETNSSAAFLGMYGGTFSSPLLSMAPKGWMWMGNFRLQNCAAYAVRMMATTPTTVSKCHEEPLKFVFEANSWEPDTLYAVGDQYGLGSGSVRPTAESIGEHGTGKYSVDGRSATGVVHGIHIDASTGTREALVR